MICMTEHQVDLHFLFNGEANKESQLFPTLIIYL